MRRVPPVPFVERSPGGHGFPKDSLGSPRRMFVAVRSGALAPCGVVGSPLPASQMPWIGLVRAQHVHRHPASSSQLVLIPADGRLMVISGDGAVLQRHLLTQARVTMSGSSL